MDRNNRYAPYDSRPPPPRQIGGGNQQYGEGNNQPYRRDDYGGGGGGGARRGRGGGAMRDRGGRRDNNERYNERPPFNKRRGPPPPPPNNYIKVKNEYEESNQAYGYEDYDETTRLPAHIETRIAKEKPCRTLFVRNVQYTIPESEVRTLFEKYGEIKDVFNLIENRGMIFVTFYDVRASEDAKEAMQGVFLSERKIDVHYSLPKEEEEKARCDRTKNQGTLLYTLKNTNEELEDCELNSYFAQFGEVKAIRIPHFKKTPANHPSHFERNQQRLIEFYDSRACVDAYDATFDSDYKSGKWDVAFFWDHPYKERANANQRRERNYDRDDRPRGGRRRSDVQIKYERTESRNMGYDHYNGGGESYAQPQVPFQQQALIPHHQQVDPRLYNSVQQPAPQLEQAQKAQQILSMLTHDNTSPYQQNMNIATSPSVHAQPHLLQQSFVQPVPPTEDQSTQVQQLLGLLSQAAQQQQVQVQLQQAQQQQQQQQLQMQQQQQQQMQQQHMSPSNQRQAGPIPGMDPTTALSHLAALLSQQSPQLPNNNQ